MRKQSIIVSAVLIATFMMCIAMPAFAAEAAADISFSTSSTNYYRGDTVYIVLSMTNVTDPTGIEGVDIESIQYDVNCLSFVSASCDEIPIGWGAQIYGGRAMITDDSGGSYPVKADDVLSVVLTFTVNIDAAFGKTSISASGSGTNNNGLEAVNLNFGSIEIEIVPGQAPPVYLRGDLNRDGKVNSNDAVHLLRHLLFGDSYPIDSNVDFDRNSKITSNDAIYLLRHTLFPQGYPL